MKSLKIVAFLLIIMSQNYFLQAQFLRSKSGTASSTARGYLRSGTLNRAELGRLTTKATSICPTSTVRGRSSTALDIARSLATKANKSSADYYREREVESKVGLAEAKEQKNYPPIDYEQFKQILENFDNYLAPYGEAPYQLIKEKNKEELEEMIQKIEESGYINRDINHSTLLTKTIASDLQEADKLKILNMLLKHGAMPGDEELLIVFNLRPNVNLKTLLRKNSDLGENWSNDANFEILEQILPYYDLATLSNIVDFAKNKIKEFKENIAPKLVDSIIKVRIAKRQKSNPRLQKRYLFLSDLNDLDIEVIEEWQEKVESEYESFVELKSIAEKNLKKIKYEWATPEKEEAQLK